MNTVISVLEGFEKLAYKFLLAILFIPKTVFQIIVNPSWVPDYIKGELNKEKSAFDGYLSPIILLLVVALIPALIYDFLPPIGVTISNTETEQEIVDQLVKQTMEAMIKEDQALADTLQQDPSLEASLRSKLESGITNRYLKFEATTTSRSGPNGMRYLHSWYVEIISDDGEYKQIYRKNYDSREFPVERINNNTTKDTFYYFFDEPGDYYINVDVEKFYGDNPIPVETFFTYSYVHVPDEPEKPIFVDNGSGSFSDRKSDQRTSFSERLKNESTIFLALGLLTPPLLFALATKVFKKNAEKQRLEITESALRESFYSQCYYFAPLGLAIWAAIFSGYYLTPDIFFYKDILIGYAVIFLPLLFAISWFIGIETDAIAHERQTSPWIAFLITLFIVAVILAVAILIIFFSDIQDYLRITAIWLYLLASAVLLAVFAFVKSQRKKTEKSTVKSGEMVVTMGLLFVVVCVGVTFAYTKKLPASTEKPEINLVNDLAETSTPEATGEAMTVIPPTEALPANISLPEAQPFYTEEFNGDPDTWRQIVVSGRESQVDRKTENGSLRFRLSPQGDSLPLVILIKEDVSYADVKIEAVTTNNGMNANGVSLICRFSEQGWYQFTISNGGAFEIYAVDATGAVNQGYNLLYNSGSSSITPGKVTNTYTAVCQGNTLTLFANDTQLYTLSDTKFNFTEGLIGIGASSPQNSPVDVQFDTLTISEP